MISVFEPLSRQCRASSSRFALRAALIGFGGTVGLTVTGAAGAADAAGAAGLGAGAAAAGLGGVSGNGVAVGPGCAVAGVAGAAAGLSCANAIEASNSEISNAKVLM